MSRLLDLAAPAALGAAATAVAQAALEARPPGGRERWRRTNFAGRDVTLLGGAAAGIGATAAPLLAAVAGGHPRVAAMAVAAAAGAAFGAVDDLTEDTTAAAKGLRGHLGALRRGRLTTGALKILGIGAGALAASALATPRPRRPGAPGARAADVLAGAALVAGTANLHNLFDLRPGRSLKVAAALSAPLALAAPAGAPGTLAAAALGVAGAALPDDLAERAMLGDTGANAVGALVGTALAAHPSRAVRAGALAGVVALTLLSEKVSFSAVIEGTPALRRLDALGRR
ncbi:hypothetical protein GCM10009790_18900 [Georgenia ruanii]|uniref:hypothetical protein n=1 Tax=Georgenia ruanii TaxID=348442 RepID=UPI0031E0CE23